MESMKNQNMFGTGSAESTAAIKWPRLEIVSEARELLVGGGAKARREIVRTSIELDRLLGEAAR